MAKAEKPQGAKGGNHLAGAYSPYLRQHMHNPVDWYGWGDKALEKARTENKPILLSVGYSTCYWCHVLEREVFEDEEVARVMNENFVNIKVDRETRPDIDEIYMLATQVLTGSGGWPNNVLLTPDLKPFYAVTYLPKDKWMNMVAGAARAWQEQRKEIAEQADHVTAIIQGHAAGTPPAAELPAPGFMAGEYFSNLDESYDYRNGGFGAGTKFPQEANLLFLLDYYHGTKRNVLAMVENTMQHMLAGGIHDHAGGGFHRYAVDQEWLVPHFEKMLYNQGLLALVLSGLYERTQKPEYKQALTALLDFTARDMALPGGAFASAWDAETDAVEGEYYVWNKHQIEKTLGKDDAAFLLERYGFAPLPHFPGHKYPDGEVLHRVKAADQADVPHLDKIFAKLRTARDQRKKPLRDDKILVSWNGMMITALAESGRVLKDPARVKQAEAAARFILGNMRSKDGSLYRAFIGGKPHQDAFLDDYAWLATGLLALHRATGDEAWRKQALFVIQTADSALLDAASGSYFLSPDTQLPVRVRSGMDGGALPSDNAVMAHVFIDLYRSTGDVQWRERAAKLIRAFAPGMAEQPIAYGHLITALMRFDDAARMAGNVEYRDDPAAGPEETKSKIKVSARIVRDQSTDTKKTVAVTVEIAEGWHLNANPASLNFLIPTVADIQTAEPSEVKIEYPAAEKYKTAVGPLSVYSGKAVITATVTAQQPVDESKMRLLLQAQACRDGACLPPSKIAAGVEK